jgi:hypothetical protein
MKHLSSFNKGIKDEILDKYVIIYSKDFTKSANNFLSFNIGYCFYIHNDMSMYFIAYNFNNKPNFLKPYFLNTNFLDNDRSKYNNLDKYTYFSPFEINNLEFKFISDNKDEAELFVLSLKYNL